MIFLVGCVDIVVDLKIDQDMSSNIVYIIDVESFPKYNQLLGNMIKKIANANDFEYRTEKDVIYISKQISDITKDYRELFLTDISTEDTTYSTDELPFKIDRGLILNTITIDQSLDLMPKDGVDDPELIDLLNTGINEYVNFSLNLTTPIKPFKSNADSIQHNTLSWNFDNLGRARIFVQYRLYNFNNIIIIVTLIIMILIALILYKRKVKDKN